MHNAKTGLRMISGSIIINAIWLVILTILLIVKPNIVLPVTLITAIVNLVCYAIELVGLFKAGKDNKRFLVAGKLKITNIVLEIILIIFAIISFYIKNDVVLQVFNIISLIITILLLVFEIVVLVNVIRGCKEISPRVAGLSKFVLAAFIIQAVFLVLAYIFQAFNNQTMATIAAVFMILAALVVIVFAICYLVLIFRTTVNVGKKKKK